MSFLLQRVFLVKCATPVLRYTVLLSLLALPLALTRLLSFYKRERPPASLLSPLPEAVVLSAFPIAWFFGFLYYTDVPSLISVVSTVVAASEDKHWTAAFVRNLHSFESHRLLMVQ
jgi:alpha-1,2-glucosyltransferase